MSFKNERRVLLFAVTAVFILLGVSPKADRFTWLLENLPVMLGAGALLATNSRFPLSRLTYRLLAVHAAILMVGGHWTYAEVPLGFWAMRAFDLSRNHYDRIGHFAQGFVPAILVREVLLRRSPLRPGGWVFFLATCVCLALSAFYEFIEWWVALATGEGATAFLGTQGDVWDAQWDMFLCTIGAILSQLLLAGFHDRSMRELPGTV
ncbi:MAG: DUF2238 domain-containing protein [Acidobacteriota bacterium]